jgi:predicted nucleic acid-binding protein
MATASEAVVDSSVIVARYVPEIHSEWALQKMSEFEYFHVLDLNYYEVANALKHKTPKSLTSKDAQAAFSKAVKLMNLFYIHNFSEIIDNALKVASNLNITVYDAAFLSLTEKLNLKLLTLDKKLAKELEGNGYYSFIECPSK